MESKEESKDQPAFDPDVTIQENFPKITRPDDWDVNFKDCRINL